MATKSEFESLDKEIKELLQNYMFKKATIYEPCTRENFKECLIGLREELELLNINYAFNPYSDFVRETIQPDALVALINSMWSLLHHHKTAVEKVANFEKENHVIQYTNKQLNNLVGKLKDEVNTQKNASKACVALAHRTSDDSKEKILNLAEMKAQLVFLNKQKDSLGKAYRNEISRLKLENQKLTDRLRSNTDTFTPCSVTCGTTILQMKEREKKHQVMIAKLQLNNQKLLQEVVAMKEKISLSRPN